MSALSQDLQTLRETLKDWMTTANPASIKERERQEQQPEPVPPVDFSPPAVSARAIDIGTVGADSPLSASTPNATTVSAALFDMCECISLINPAGRGKRK